MPEAMQAMSAAWRGWLKRARLFEVVAGHPRPQRSDDPLPLAPGSRNNRWFAMCGEIDMGYVELAHDLHCGEYWKWGFYKPPPKQGALWGIANNQAEAATEVTRRFRDWLEMTDLAECIGLQAGQQAT
ncbi:hypothetical protein [Flaviflagellibacter deserti]|uniref:Uncharacterized protein n=1 Tax=Flaviflagellibacter deserti TaxID=2267266 RepID=A0ABV9Z5A7_9HYPH